MSNSLTAVQIKHPVAHWAFTSNDRIVALIVMDPQLKVWKVVLAPDISDDETVTVLRRVATHAITYEPFLKYTTLSVSERPNFDPHARENSDAIMMDTDISAEVALFGLSEIRQYVRLHDGIDVVCATVWTLDEVLAEIQAKEEFAEFEVTFVAEGPPGDGGLCQVRAKAQAVALAREHMLYGVVGEAEVRWPESLSAKGIEGVRAALVASLHSSVPRSAGAWA